MDEKKILQKFFTFIAGEFDFIDSIEYAESNLTVHHCALVTLKKDANADPSKVIEYLEYMGILGFDFNNTDKEKRHLWIESKRG